MRTGPTKPSTSAASAASTATPTVPHDREVPIPSHRDDASHATVSTRIGDIPLELGLPVAADTVGKLYDELDFQRASQAYIWALPIVGHAQWQQAARTVFGARDTDMVIYETIQDKLGILTANATTPYIGGFPDLSKTGPLVIDYPAGPTAGGIGDCWQRSITDLGETGPDRGKGAKYLVVGPGQPTPDAPGHTVVHSPTNNVFVAFRVLEADPAKGRDLIGRFRMYPYSETKNPPTTRLLHPDGRAWTQMPPHGFAYWERLHDIVQREPVMERDRMIMAMLKPLGIEKGKPFRPNARQRRLLEDGAQVGELMAQAISFSNREDGARYRPDSQWQYVITFDPSQEAETYSQLDERAHYFYEAVGSSRGMVSQTPGVGQAYLGAYTDAAGEPFDGGKAYSLHVPPKPPAKLFWSVTVYDALTRVLIDNPQHIADRSSRSGIVANPDGSVDLYFGPTPPPQGEQNWIPTVPGKAWFAYFRLYGPTEEYFGRSWHLPDIEAIPDIKTIAKQAYLYAYAMLESYQTMYRQAIDKNSPAYVGGFGRYRHYSTPFTPDNRDIVTPNNDTPYSWAWLDLRAEPWVLSVPAVPKDRYYVTQWFDLFTQIFAYVGVRATGFEAGHYLIVGPKWKGTMPADIDRIFRPETDLVGTLTRTALAGPDDVPNVKAIQAALTLQPLSQFLGTPAPPSAPAITFPPYDKARARTHDFIGYLSFLLQFAEPPYSGEVEMRRQFAMIGIVPGARWDPDAVDPVVLADIDAGIAEGQAELDAELARTFTSNGLFGSREFLKTNFLKRDVAANKGLYGNALEEAWYGGYEIDDGAPTVIRFRAGELPPAQFFWSMTLYTLPDRFLYANALNRYSIGDRTKGLVYGDDGSLTLYVGNASPGKAKESNWLPAPAGAYSLVIRVYGPKPELIQGKWKLPPLERAR